MTNSNDKTLIINSDFEYQQALKSGAIETATIVEVWYCHALTAITAPAATSVKVWYCRALTAITAPAATSVEVWDCPALTEITTTHGKHAVTCIDGYSMHLGRWRAVGDAKVCKAKYIGFSLEEFTRDCFVAKVGNHYAHGETTKAAIEDAIFKALDHGDMDQVIDAVIEAGVVTMNEWRVISGGACREGTAAFLGITVDELEDLSPMDLAEAMTKCKGSEYGQRFIERIEERKAA